MNLSDPDGVLENSSIKTYINANYIDVAFFPFLILSFQGAAPAGGQVEDIYWHGGPPGALFRGLLANGLAIQGLRPRGHQPKN